MAVNLVATVNKTFFSGEYTWNSQSRSSDDSLASFFQAIEQSPVAGGDMFWSLFGHNVPDCNVNDPRLHQPFLFFFLFFLWQLTNQNFVNHNDGLTMHLGNPANSAFINSRIQLIRQHFLKMSQGLTIGADAALPIAACPAPEIPTK